MLSKPAIFAAGIALVRGDAKMIPVPDGVNRADTWGCARCIRHGFNWVSQYYGRTDLVIDGGNLKDHAGSTLGAAATLGYCCPAGDTTCATGFAGDPWKTSETLGADVALSRCPSKVAQCYPNYADAGAGPVQQFPSTVTDVVTLSIAATTTPMTMDDQCVYTVEATCGAPGLSIDSSSSVGNEDFAIFYLDYLQTGTDKDGNAYTVTADALKNPERDDGAANMLGVAAEGEINTDYAATTDYSGHIPSDPHAFTYRPSDATWSEPEKDFVVPGMFAGKWFKSYADEVTAFGEAKTQYETDLAAW